jgi:hypothetical protein
MPTIQGEGAGGQDENNTGWGGSAGRMRTIQGEGGGGQDAHNTGWGACGQDENSSGRGCAGRMPTIQGGQLCVVGKLVRRDVTPTYPQLA